MRKLWGNETLVSKYDVERLVIQVKEHEFTYLHFIPNVTNVHCTTIRINRKRFMSRRMDCLLFRIFCHRKLRVIR